jgi:hypothetical protein
MKTEDEGIRPVREVRGKISAEFGNDPVRLVDHYLAEQERYRARLLPPVAAQRADAADDASRRR